jgi:hypothetical protein
VRRDQDAAAVRCEVGEERLEQLRARPVDARERLVEQQHGASWTSASVCRAALRSARPVGRHQGTRASVPINATSSALTG